MRLIFFQFPGYNFIVSLSDFHTQTGVFRKLPIFGLLSVSLNIEWHLAMKTSLISILLGFTFIISGSAQAWTLDEEWLLNERYLGSINQFFCKAMVVAGSDEQSGEDEKKEEEEEPDCD